jgi:hypothetical protein
VQPIEGFDERINARLAEIEQRIERLRHARDYWQGRYHEAMETLRSISANELAGLPPDTRAYLLRGGLIVTRLQLRRATDEELLLLKGIGPARLAEIHAWLEEHR